ncbi:putative pentatricopeptide repeat-containing protein At5g40405 [Hordeum vulgare subsp. vulgare]|uniref:DYW domain-containing protein n=2 Tax=Hordeum vulgare subsp. vulgare TaxID=112509 RepID=A0A8I6X7H1_HORVV|nr:putative pentatricopeptide repeat-containing protein At5g40405 [Hordeum vulgare subsp. vulgare]
MAPLPRRLVPLRDSATLLLLPSLVAASSQSQFRLREIHAHLLVSGRLASPSHHADFVASLASSSHLSYARLLLPQRPATLLAHNGLLRALARGPCPGLAFAAFRELPLAPDHYSFTFLVRAATSLAAAASATPVPTDVAVNLLAGSVHAAAFQHGHATDPHVQSGAVSMYAAVGDVGAVRAAFAEIVSPDVVCVTAMLGALSAGGDVDTARELFDGMPQRDHVAWNAMLTGYVRVGRSREALGLFDEMQKAGVAVSEVTLVSVLTACAQMGALERGMWVHSYVCSRGMRVSVTLGTALVDMYSKCGVVTMSMEVFETMRERNIYTWTSALSGLAMNGMGEECLELFKRMESAGMEPNGVTFVAVLRGCSVAGLVEEGRACFDSMKDKHKVEPWLEHYGCMVDLYGRAGRLDDAVDFINSMPVEPHEGVWGALLNASRIHNNVDLGKHAMHKLTEIESKNDAAHVLLSNIYAESHNWKGVSKVRNMMKSKGVKKMPGCSAIEVDGKVHEFFVGSKSHPRYKDIQTMLAEMSHRLRLQGYAANTKEVLFDIEEEEKEGAISLHSEKLALAFGLITLPEDTVIRIVKNLRVCKDCHDYTKLISKVFDREIVMRDRNRFHHFKHGACSCRDYW